MNGQTDLVPAQPAPLKTVAIELTPQEIIALRAKQLEVIEQLMHDKVHFGKIPGTPKPSLWQPGAQLLDTLHGFAATFEEIRSVEDFERGFFNFTYRCRLVRRSDGIVVGEAVGSCNSMEKHYREAIYHGAQEGEPVNPRDNVNTYLKMAQKRAHVAATLNATGLADYFTQDLEDMPGPSAGGQKSRKQALGRCAIHNKDIIKGKWGPYCPTKVEGTDGKQAWCKGESPPQEAQGVASESQGELPDPTTFKNLGDLFTACQKHLGVARPDVLKILGLRDTTAIGDLDNAWYTVLATKQGPPVEAQASPAPDPQDAETQAQAQDPAEGKGE